MLSINRDGQSIVCIHCCSTSTSPKSPAMVLVTASHRRCHKARVKFPPWPGPPRLEPSPPRNVITSHAIHPVCIGLCKLWMKDHACSRVWKHICLYVWTLWKHSCRQLQGSLHKIVFLSFAMCYQSYNYTWRCQRDPTFDAQLGNLTTKLLLHWNTSAFSKNRLQNSDKTTEILRNCDGISVPVQFWPSIKEIRTHSKCSTESTVNFCSIILGCAISAEKNHAHVVDEAPHESPENHDHGVGGISTTFQLTEFHFTFPRSGLPLENFTFCHKLNY